MFAGNITGLIDGEDPMRADADAGRTAIDAPLHDVGDLASRGDAEAEALDLAVLVERLFVSGCGDLVDVVLCQLRQLVSFVHKGVDHAVGTVGAVAGRIFSGAHKQFVSALYKVTTSSTKQKASASHWPVKVRMAYNSSVN